MEALSFSLQADSSLLQFVDADVESMIPTPRRYLEYDTHRAISLMDGRFPYMSNPTR